MGKPGKQIQLRGSAVTNVGQVRSHNEDNVHLWSDNNLILAIVADGMGGAAAGEEASRIAVETITNQLGIDDPTPPGEVDFPETLLSKAVKAANMMIMQEAVAHPSNRGMGTTVTMAFVRGDVARFAHVGDSRAYRVDKHGDIEQITSDHSFVQALVEAKHITQEQAETHPMRNVLYRALGQTQDLDVDTYHAELNVGDRLVLCSDGLTGHVRAPEIAQIASESDNPNTISQKLVELANQRGGEDNISVIVILVDEKDTQTNVAVKPAHQDGDDTEIIKDHAPKETRAGQDFTDDSLPKNAREGNNPELLHMPINTNSHSHPNHLAEGHDAPHSYS